MVVVAVGGLSGGIRVQIGNSIFPISFLYINKHANNSVYVTDRCTSSRKVNMPMAIGFRLDMKKIRKI